MCEPHTYTQGTRHRTENRKWGVTGKRGGGVGSEDGGGDVVMAVAAVVMVLMEKVVVMTVVVVVGDTCGVGSPCVNL